jgi:methionyl-tRNA formyltransferase
MTRMRSNRMRIVFMGTPDFAVPCLARILDEGHDVVGVFCQPDKPKGRGYTLTPPPVKQLAEAKGIPVYQPTKLRDGSALEVLRELAPELIVVVAYGRILPLDILEMPRLGCVNIHASLLPKLRGAAPIQWSVINGDEVTGITVMYMAEGMDTGDIILTEETPIALDETAGELFGRLSVMGADCLAKVLPLLESGAAPRTPQDDTLATYAPMLDKAMGEIDFTKSGREIVNLGRGLNPAPCAYTAVGGKRLKVHKAAVVSAELLGDRKRLVMSCGDGAVELLLVQPEGKKVMEGSAYRMGIR